MNIAELTRADARNPMFKGETASPFGRIDKEILEISQGINFTI
jgi:hypothetical protein